jgi:hypothetical protein
MAQQSDTSLHLQKAWDLLFAFRKRVDVSEQGIRRSIIGTGDCIASSRKLLAEIDDGIAKLNGK